MQVLSPFIECNFDFPALNNQNISAFPMSDLTLPANESSGSVDGRRFVAMFFAMLACAGFFLAATFGTNIFVAKQAEKWPVTQGFVWKSELSKNIKNNGYAPYVDYTYTVAGTAYEGHVITIGPEIASAAKIVSRYPVGPVLVAFNPESPEKSALSVKSVPQGLLLDFCWAAVSFAITAALAVLFLRSAIKAERRNQSDYSR